MLTSILLFIFAAIIAALSGDYSGINAIAKIIMYGLMIYLVACKPSIFWMIVIISVIYVVYSMWKQDKNK